MKRSMKYCLISSGKGRLTDKIMNKMQNYYGMAIRQNPGQLVT